eukprot:4927792-Prymnesium_polylepis.1
MHSARAPTSIGSDESDERKELPMFSCLHTARAHRVGDRHGPPLVGGLAGGTPAAQRTATCAP